MRETEFRSIVEAWLPSVRAAGAWLDEARPGWRELVDVDDLDMGSSLTDLAAQVTVSDEGIDFVAQEALIQAADAANIVTLGGKAAWDLDDNHPETGHRQAAALTGAWRRYLLRA